MEGPSVRHFKTICVFCGASKGKDKEFLRAANNLGHVLSARNINLVYGGGSLGLMGSVASSAYLGGSKVLGVLPKALARGTGMTIGSELQVATMPERMSNMCYNADAFIALPGGLGTLEEIFQVSSWAQLNIHHKPIGLLNVNGFFDSLLSFLDHAVEQELLSPLARRILLSAPTADELIDQLQAFVSEPDPKLALIDWSNKPSSKRSRLDLSLSL